MPSFTVRDIPPTLMTLLRDVAKKERRSMNSEFIHWLEDAAELRARDNDLDALLSRIEATREAMRRRHGRGSDSVPLIRQMRNRRAKTGS